MSLAIKLEFSLKTSQNTEIEINVSSSLDSACVNYNLDGIVSNKGNRRGIKIIKNKNGKYIKVFSDK